MSKNELKRQLKVLKSRISKPEGEIKHVSLILRKKFRKKRSAKRSDYYKSVWKYCEKVLEPKEERVKSLITKNDCEKYFKNILSEKNR